MLVVFLILHYKNIRVTDRCIESILKLNNYNNTIKIVIVDNGSEDESTVILKNKYSNNSMIDLILLKSGNGFSRGNNIGYEYIKKKYRADYLIVANNDIIFSQKDFLLKMEAEYKKYKYYVMGPNTIDLNSKSYLNPKEPLKTLAELEKQLIILKERRNSFFLKEILIAWFQKSKIYPFYIKNIRNKRISVKTQEKLAKKHCTDRIIQGSCLIFSKDFFESNEKLFWPETTFYVEEPILCHRCQKNNWKVLYSPELTVLHEQGASFKISTKKIKDRIKRDLEFNIEGMEIYIRMLKEIKNRGK
ncbi:glycosyltransferase family 2 protein (plasmid) [Fusobacterium sp. SB021]|uniref:glycosyltransferase family 2 protein n=1 Tax=Fusobacterium sp. SB021 TaxID=2744227 RepID=UPI003CEC5D70